MSFIIDLTTLFPFAIASIVGNRDGVADDRDDNEANDPQAEDPTQEQMSAKPAAATVAAKSKSTAGKKTTGESEADYLPAARKVPKLYGFGTEDVFAVSYDTQGTTDYCHISFYLSGVMPEDGFSTSLSLDGYTISMSHPVDAFLFSMEHLKKIMGEQYSENHIRVRSFDQVTQAILADKNKADARDLFWGKPQEIHLKDKCTGDVITKVTPYPRKDVPSIKYKGAKHRQFNTIVEMKVKLAEQRKTATKKTKTEKPLEIYSSQEGSTPSPGARSRRKRKYCDWGGSHREATYETTGRASRVSNESNGYSSNEESG